MALLLSGKVSRRWQIISVRSLFGCQETKFNMKREKQKTGISTFRNRMWHKHWRGVMATGSACCFIVRKDWSVSCGSTWQPWHMTLKKTTDVVRFPWRRPQCCRCLCRAGSKVAVRLRNSVLPFATGWVRSKTSVSAFLLSQFSSDQVRRHPAVFYRFSLGKKKANMLYSEPDPDVKSVQMQCSTWL